MYTTQLRNERSFNTYNSQVVSTFSVEVMQADFECNFILSGKLADILFTALHSNFIVEF